jgi:hypothetical protein
MLPAGTSRGACQSAVHGAVRLRQVVAVEQRQARHVSSDALIELADYLRLAVRANTVRTCLVTLKKWALLQQKRRRIRFHIFGAVPPCFRTRRGGCSAHLLRGWGTSMARPAVILVGADKGGVGKTTVSRTLLDYFASRKVPTRAFDTEHPRGTLVRFHPDITDVVDVTSVPDQMKIFDTIESSAAQITLIDIRAGLMLPTLRALRDIGFLDMAKKDQLNFAVFHILGPSIASLDEIAETSKFLVDARYFLVKNFINDTTFFDWDQGTYNSYFNRIKDAVDIKVPKLSEMACEQVELSSVPFASFIADRKANGEAASNSFVLRGYVRHWLNNVWAEYDRVRLMDLIDARGSLGKPRQIMPVAEAS